MNSKNFDPEEISVVIEEMLDKITKELDPELLSWMKQKFESSIPPVVDENFGDITMEIVVDSSSVINQLNHFAEGKSSLLSHLIENPIFPLCAPPQLEEEVLDYIENKARKKFNKEKLLEGWSILKSGITIKKIQNDEAVIAATKIMERDPNDVSFVSLVIDTGASAILSQDDDFVDSVRRFTVKSLGEMVGVYHRGLFSFFIMSDLVPLVLKTVGGIMVEIVKILVEFLALIATFIVAMVKGAVNTLSEMASKLPGWTRALVIAIITIIPIILTEDDKARESVILGLKSLWKKTKPTVDKITDWLSKCIKLLLEYLEKARPYVEISATAISDLQEQIETMKSEIKNMKFEDAINYS